jgi:mannose-1-phosphate guanylyltransferase
MGRDTANAVGFSAAVLHKRDPDATFAVLTADHIIEPIDIFQTAMAKAFDAAEKRPEFLFTFGITPTHPATGYGYVQRGPELPGLPGGGVYQVGAFKEKPDLATAQKFLAARTPQGQPEFAWNSGMFVWKASTILDQIRQHLPAAHAGLMQIAAAWDTPRQAEVLNAVYPTLQKISIDVGIMEKAAHVAMIPMAVNWLDVGSWPSYGETLPADPSGNRTGAGARVVHLNSKNVLAVTEQSGEGAANAHLIATIGCQDLIIIHTPRATLVCPANQAEKIKQLVAEVEKQQGKEFV